MQQSAACFVGRLVCRDTAQQRRKCTEDLLLLDNLYLSVTFLKRSRPDHSTSHGTEDAHASLMQRALSVIISVAFTSTPNSEAGLLQ